jgi:uncharacterized SAM-binding protein YcdF (DUF218 family)
MGYPFDCISDFIFVEDLPQKADVILIPGGSHPQLMVKAVELYRQGLAPYILPSGGPNPKIPDYASEWEFLEKIALGLGMPEKAILKEEKAHDTFENASFSRQILQDMQVKVDTAILVCKAYHSRRALLTYQAIFPSKTRFFVAPVIDNRGISKSNWYTKEEYVAVVMGEVRKIGQYFVDKICGWQETTEVVTTTGGPDVVTTSVVKTERKND